MREGSVLNGRSYLILSVALGSEVRTKGRLGERKQLAEREN